MHPGVEEKIKNRGQKKFFNNKLKEKYKSSSIWQGFQKRKNTKNNGKKIIFHHPLQNLHNKWKKLQKQGTLWWILRILGD